MASRSKSIYSSLALLLIGLLSLLVGCGGEKKLNPLAQSLAYLPEDAPLVVLASTDLSKPEFLTELRFLSQLPAAERLLPELEGRGPDKLSFKRDIKPWLGRRLIVASFSLRDLERGRAVAVQLVKSQAALERAEKSLIGRGLLSKVERYLGADLYRLPERDLYLTTDQRALLVANSLSTLKRAISNKRSGTGFSEAKLSSAFNHRLARTPISAYLDIHRLLLDSEAGLELLKVPWFASLSTAAIQARFERDRIKLSLRLKSDLRDLNPEDVPIATGKASPKLAAVSGGYLTAGLRDLAHTLRFGSDLLSATRPDLSAFYQESKAVLRDTLAVDLDQDLIDQLTGDSVIAVGKSGLVVKADLNDPEALSDGLDQVAKAAETALKLIGLDRYRLRTETNRGENIYRLQDGGKNLLSFTVAESSLFFATGSHRLEDLRAVESLKGSRGALIFSLDLSRDVFADSALARGILSYLKDFENLSGSFEASTERVVGSLTLR